MWIPKADGKTLRPLGIPRIADRVVMTAAMVVLEPIFEVDMPAEQHGYRPNLSAHTAVTTVGRLINGGHTRVIDADLADYFGSILHAELLKSVARRVSDRHLLHLILNTTRARPNKPGAFARPGLEPRPEGRLAPARRARLANFRNAGSD